MISASYDDKTGIIRTVTDGDTSSDDLEGYIEEHVGLRQRARSQYGRVLHLVDAASAGVQSRDDFRELARSRIMHNGEQDRTAIVIHSVPAKMQIGQMPDGGRLRFFSDLQEAETWLREGGDIARRA